VAGGFNFLEQYLMDLRKRQLSLSLLCMIQHQIHILQMLTQSSLRGSPLKVSF